MRISAVALTLAVAAVTAVACGDDNTSPPVSKIVNFDVQLTPGGEPGTLNGNPTGSGHFTATLDTSTGVFTWNGTFSGLTSNVNNGHIHGPFIPGVSTGTTASPLVNFNTTPGGTFVGFQTANSGSVSGSLTLNASTTITSGVNGDSLKKLLLAGATYVNIHTVTNGGGEIRAQLVKK